ncbi:hypothetical protein ACHAPE_010400 [Trichoderma viride]
MTAAIGLFNSLALPEPWCQHEALREQVKDGVVVYGAASAVGSFAIKLLRKADIHPIIAVAGKGISFVEGLIDRVKGDLIIDYREADDAIIKGIKQGIRDGESLRYAFDAVSQVTPGHDYSGLPASIRLVQTNVTTAHTIYKDFATSWFRLFYYGLKDGWLKGHPYEVVPGGLEGLQHGLESLRDGKASGTKYVYRIGKISEY